MGFKRFWRRVKRAVRKAVKAVVDSVTTVINAVIEVFESTLGWALSGGMLIIGFIFSIPFFGRFIRWVWNSVLSIAWSIVGIPDFLLSLIGILPEKKLRVCVIILSDESGAPVEQEANIVPELQNAIDIFWERANVRIIRSAPFQFDSGFADVESADEEWIHVFAPINTTVLDVNCGTKAAREDLGKIGSNFELAANLVCLYGNSRRVIGYGAPICVFVVRTISGALGCSLGPLADYVIVQAVGRDPLTIAHELGHACNLCDVDDPSNLMGPNVGRDLRRGQVAILRNSRHVTYF